ncbi:uncharacterized protein MONBRDRAFT_32328 [Monosiga brevicollis MX1]|uniref:Acyltransferase n=1 Tax=Monosiga brevicollis TaxID=81824 RepID=A9UYU2_MONBE|nr:uncharacterized protein MONBRDRAFT_32328 [Monosiga brevicollis MX1]EDQ89521.1 predicted protein [Monosiga brevicollis MX1]|eukprot:XP_001745550.1 hypothetical protein [Monosiga brevicollis MX1]
MLLPEGIPMDSAVARQRFRRMQQTAAEARVNHVKLDDLAKIEEPTILTPKRVSFCVLISTVFCLIYLWFRRGIFAVWDSLAFTPASLVEGALPTPGHSLSDEDQFHFAFIAASTHTTAVLVGMSLFGATSIFFSNDRIRQHLTQRHLRVAQVSIIGLLAYGFYNGLSTWFTTTFEDRDSSAYRWARAFFYESGDIPFASCASLSYCLCLLAGYLIKLSTDGSRFSAFPRCYRRYVWRGIAYFLVSVVSFRFIAIPFFKHVTQPILLAGKRLDPTEAFNPNFVTLASGTHTLGVLVYSVVTGAQAGAEYVRVHWKDVPASLVSLSHLVWFAFGWLVWLDLFPTVVRNFLRLLVLPLKLSLNSNNALRNIWRLLVVATLYNLEKITVTALILSYILAPVYPNLIAATWTAILIRYMPTYRNHPMLTGCRRLEDFRRHWIMDELVAYFNFDLFARQKTLNPEHRYIFGFHPHGVLPISIGFVQNNAKWRQQFPGVEPAPVTSSILHHVPLMRDFLQVVGGGDVSKRGIAVTLQREKSVILVPGGQQEMIYTSSTREVVTICSKHKGFVRLAYQLAAASEEPLHLVPMFNFGENKILDNVPAPISWQQASVRWLRANVFFGPWGRFGLPGVPRNAEMHLAVGEALRVPRVAQPTKEDVDMLHGRYMQLLKEAFDEFKGKTSAYRQAVMDFDQPVNLVARESWRGYSTGLQERHETQHLRVLMGKRADQLEMIWTSIFWVLVFSVIYWRAFFLSDSSLLSLL